MPIESLRDIARYFQNHSIQVRPEAATLLLQQTQKITYTESRQRYLDKFINLLRDFQRTSQVSALASGQANAQSNVLDKEAATLVM